VSVAVSDSGAGFPPQVSERLFEPFFTTKTEGLGLGLSICRSIVSLHSGWISARNNSDRGATVEFVLPVAPAELQYGEHYGPPRGDAFAGRLHVNSGR
jgi:signal transduction histidine kinase